MQNYAAQQGDLREKVDALRFLHGHSKENICKSSHDAPQQ